MAEMEGDRYPVLLDGERVGEVEVLEAHAEGGEIICRGRVHLDPEHRDLEALRADLKVSIGTPLTKGKRHRVKLRDAQELRKRGWTPEEIAAAMQVSQPTISRWLRGTVAS